MATSFKVFLDDRRRNNKETYPLKIRITIDRKLKEVPLNLKVEKKYWDANLEKIKSTLPNYKQIQLSISNKLTELQRKILTLENNGNKISISEISSSPKSKEVKVGFIAFANREISLMLEIGRVGNSLAYQSAISKLQKFIGKNDIEFESLNYAFIEKFVTSMLNDGLKTNAIACYLREIRAIYNKAIKLDLVDYKFYPFLKYKIKTEKTINRALTLEEIKLILNYDFTSNKSLCFHQSLFILSFSLIGINYTDLLTIKDENLINGRLVFHRKKTKKVYSIKLNKISKKHLNYLTKCKTLNTNYLLPIIDSKTSLLSQKKNIKLIIHANNNNLKKIATQLGINKPISTYYARYTWANIAKSLGYSKDLIAEALGHEYGNKVTGIYLDNFDKELIDEMNEKVCNIVFNTML